MKYASLNNSHNNFHRNYTNGIVLVTNTYVEICTAPKMIPTPKWSPNRPWNDTDPEMIPKSTLKWYRPQNDPQIDPEMISISLHVEPEMISII